MVKQRCLRFLAGGSAWEALWTETTTSQPDPPSAQTAADRDEVQRQRRDLRGLLEPGGLLRYPGGASSLAVKSSP